MTPDDLLTKKDLEDFKQELFNLLSTFTTTPPQSQQKWLKNVDVKKLLNVSASTLQSLRLTGALPYNKVGGTYYYKHQDVESMLNGPEKKARKENHNST